MLEIGHKKDDCSAGPCSRMGALLVQGSFEGNTRIQPVERENHVASGGDTIIFVARVQIYVFGEKGVLVEGKRQCLMK